MVKPCKGFCGDQGYHTHDLTLVGKWHFNWKYKVLAAVLQDPRPQPPVDENNGAPWYSDYVEVWQQSYPGYTNGSHYIRDTDGHWVWVTNTPQFDRNWFDQQGWQFPAAWITGPSETFYGVGKDAISTIVSLPIKGGSGVTEDVSK